MPVTRHDVHLCLVSQQATPNYIPALDSRFRPKEIVLLVSDDMQHRADWLSEALKSRGIRCSSQNIGDPWNVAEIQDRVLDLLIKYEGHDIALNVTGGTKPMAIAAQDVFRAAHKPIFYVHPQRNEVLPLFCQDDRFEIQERVTLADYLSIHGFHELGRDTNEYPDKHNQLCDEWVKEVERYGKPLRTLNHLAFEAKATLTTPLGDAARDERFREVVEKLLRLGLATITNSRLEFLDEKTRFFANGGWLEIYVNRVASGISRELKIHDIARSLRVASAGGPQNEIDLAVLASNRLFLIECKTRVMHGDEADGPGAHTLYKLDSLTSLGGLNTRGMIVSYQELTKWDRQRAKDLRINIIEAGQLRNLQRHIREWVAPDHP